MQRAVGQLHRHRFDRAVTAEGEGRDAPEGGDILVLLTDGFAQAVDLEMAGLLREFAWLERLALADMQSLEQRRRERPGGARPVPAGISAIELISRLGCVTPTIRMASRMMGCWISAALATRSSLEYFRMKSSVKFRWTVT